MAQFGFKVFKASTGYNQTCFIEPVEFELPFAKGMLTQAYSYSLSSPKRKAKAKSLLWFILAIESFKNSNIYINEPEGYVEAYLECNLLFDDVDSDTLINDLQLNIKNSLLLLGAYILKTNINNIKLLGDINIINECIDDDCNKTQRKMIAQYTIANKTAYKGIMPVLGAIFADYIGLYNVEDISKFYSEEYNRRYLDPHKLDEVDEIRKVKDELVKLGYIDKHYSPNLKQFSFEEIRSKISELFNRKKLCAICGKEFVASKDNQVVCGNLTCQKRQNRIKKRIFEKFTKDTPKRKIIDYFKKSEERTYNRYKASDKIKFEKVKDWDALIDKLLEDLGWKG